MSDTRQCHAENHDGFSSLEPWFSGTLAPEPLTAAWWVGIMEHRAYVSMVLVAVHRHGIKVNYDQEVKMCKNAGDLGSRCKLEIGYTSDMGSCGKLKSS